MSTKQIPYLTAKEARELTASGAARLTDSVTRRIMREIKHRSKSGECDCALNANMFNVSCVFFSAHVEEKLRELGYKVTFDAGKWTVSWKSE